MTDLTPHEALALARGQAGDVQVLRHYASNYIEMSPRRVTARGRGHHPTQEGDIVQDFTTYSPELSIGKVIHWPKPESEDYECEKDFQERLANILSAEPYNHTVVNEVSYRTPEGKRGRLDLYVVTDKDWPPHEKFPVIGVETKLAHGLGWLIDGITQVHRYRDDLPKATYKIAGEEVAVPDLFLVVTPESWEQGYIYPWRLPEWPDFDQCRCAWDYMTRLYERVLMKCGASVLKRRPSTGYRGFFTNIKGNRGAVHWYDI